MAQTLQQLQDEIYADIPQIRGSADFPVTRLTRYINEAIRFVQIELNGLGMKRWEKSASLTLSSGTFGTLSVKKASIPTDLLENPSSIIMIDCTTGVAPGPGIDPKMVQKNWSNGFMAPTTSDPAFCRISGQIFLFPSSITTATIYYYQALADLVSQSDLCQIPIEFDRFVIDRAKLSVYDALQMVNDVKSAEEKISNAISEQYQKFLMTKQTNKIERNQAVQLQ